ncbi:MAG TPA: Fic family protein [Kofleriaceae bacterium]|nr:Fic family protein [Kofleriaceae bacterium]
MIFAAPEPGAHELEVLDQIKELWKLLQAGIQNHPMKWSGLLARNLRAWAIQGSNGIEGFHVTAEDALAAVDGDTPEEADREAWEAVVGYRTAMDYVLRLGPAAEFAYDANLIRSLHFMMTRHSPPANPGVWRPGAIWVRHASTGDVVYEGPPRALVPSLVDELCAELSARDGDASHRLIRAAMAHLNLVMIHPFSDGNGRMSRCLQTLVLARGGMLSPTFCSIEEYLGHNTQAYYEVLAATGHGTWSPSRSAVRWIRFCLTAHYRQAEMARRRLDATARIGRTVEERLARAGLPDRAAISLTNAVLGVRVRNEGYRREADVSQNVASRDLAALSAAKFLTPFGAKRGRYYVAGPALDDLRAMNAAVRAIPDPFARR